MISNPRHGSPPRLMVHQPTRCSTTQESSIRVHRPEPVSHIAALEAPHARTLARFRLEDAAFHAITKAAAVAVLLILGGVIAALVYGALPAFRTFGTGFFVSARWNPVTEKFGALAPIYGTLVTALIAMLIAVPVGLGVAIFLTELCPPRLRQ